MSSSCTGVYGVTAGFPPGSDRVDDIINSAPAPTAYMLRAEAGFEGFHLEVCRIPPQIIGVLKTFREECLRF